MIWQESTEQWRMEAPMSSDTDTSGGEEREDLEWDLDERDALLGSGALVESMEPEVEVIVGADE